MKKLFIIIFPFLMSSALAWTTNDIAPLLAELPAGAVHQHVMMPMRDGARLSTHIFLPADYATNSYPVVLLRSAYNYWPDKDRYIDDIVDQSDTNNFVYKNTNGYVYVMQDLRGDGDSEAGVDFEPRLSDNEINDAYDTIEALATNSWCNGRVGMYGGSGFGMAAYMGWYSKAPHLVVSAPGNTGPNLYEHWGFENGVRRWVYNWLSNRGADTSEWPKPTLGDYYSHADWDAVLSQGAVSNHAILMASDVWHNFFLDSTFEVFSAMSAQNKGYLVMDSGTHQGDLNIYTPATLGGITNVIGFPNPSGATTKMYLPSFLEILDGATITNNFFLQYYVMGDARRANAEGNFWRETESWPPPALKTAYYMHADGTLSTVAPTSTTDSLSYTYHPTNPVPTVGGNYSYGFTDLSGPLDQNVPELTSRNDILRFETAPFTEATEITGRLEAQIYVSTDVEDTTFMVKLIDIYPAEGTNVEYHAIMRESAIMGRYWGGLTNPAPMVSGSVYRLDIDMSTISLLVETNHRVAVHITSSSDKAFEVHPNTYEQVSSYAGSPTANNTLYLNTDYPSRIILPLYTTNSPSVSVSSTAVSVDENGTATFDVWMSGVAQDSVTLSVSRVSGDTDLSVQSGGSLVFTSGNWTTPQTVTLAAASDADASDGSAEFEITAPGVVSATVTATENDDDAGIIATPSSLNVPEGQTAAFSLTLNNPPASAVTVSVSRTSGDTDLSVSGSSSFVFDSANWNIGQAVTLAAAEDADETAGSAVFTCAAAGAISTTVSATEVENDYSLIASGLLASWNLQTVAASPIVTATNASFLSTGLVQSATGGVLTHSYTNRMVGRANALAANFTGGYATLDAALSAGYYFKWTLEPQSGYKITITNIQIVTEHENAAITGVLFSAVSGLTSADELGRMPGQLHHSSFDIDGRITDVEGPVEFRLYGFGNSSQYQATMIGDMYSSVSENDIAIYGTITSGGTASGDEDSDGLPDEWELLHFGGATNATPSDLTANGINTLQEAYIAGLDPTNASSKLLLNRTGPLAWNAVSGRVYNIYWTSNLLSSFTQIQTNFSGGVFTDQVHGTKSAGFYRIDVMMAP